MKGPSGGEIGSVNRTALRPDMSLLVMRRTSIRTLNIVKTNTHNNIKLLSLRKGQLPEKGEAEHLTRGQPMTREGRTLNPRATNDTRDRTLNPRATNDTRGQNT